jgi:hypothetical protein
MQLRGWWPRLAISALLGFVTLGAIGIAKDHGPGVGLRNLAELFLLPGAMLGMVVSPDAVHGSSPMLWGAAVICGNFIFYSALWLLVLAASHRRRPARAGSGPEA